MSRRKILKKIWWDKRARKIQSQRSKNKVSKVRRKSVEKKDVYEYSLIDFFLKKRFISKHKCHSKVRLEVPEKFNFYNNIDETLAFLKEIVYLISKSSLKEIFINHCSIRQISLSASLLLDLILMDAEKYVKGTKHRTNLSICGEVKRDTDVGILLHANGVLPHLGFKVEKDPNVRTLDLLFGNRETGNVSDPASDILKYFSNCLKMQGYAMTREGKRALGKFLGEVFDNCRTHSGREGRWYALGFYHNKEEKGICHIAIITLGDTIYDSLTKEGNVTSETYEALEQMTIRHRQQFDSEWNKEMLWTWLSLQHGVSRLRDSAVLEQSNRGMGTIDMMEAFQEIGNTMDEYRPVFSIVSGHVAILFDFEKYPVEHVKIKNEERRIVAFNKEKSLEKRPDPQNVRRIENYFPGTIYTLEFCIDPAFLEGSRQTYVRRTVKSE